MSGLPVFQVPPDLVGPGELRVWFTEPPGAVMQMIARGRGTKEMAEWLVGPALTRLRDRFPQCSQLILVLDFALLEGRDPAARVVMMDKGRECAALFSQSFLIRPEKANPVYITTLHAAAALLSAFGVNLEISNSLREVISRCNLHPAGTGEH
jgi:hypothetical protein